MLQSANISTWKWCPCSDLMPSKLGFLELSKGHSSSSPLPRSLTLRNQYRNNGYVFPKQWTQWWHAAAARWMRVCTYCSIVTVRYLLLRGKNCLIKCSGPLCPYAAWKGGSRIATKMTFENLTREENTGCSVTNSGYERSKRSLSTDFSF